MVVVTVDTDGLLCISGGGGVGREGDGGLEHLVPPVGQPRLRLPEEPHTEDGLPRGSGRSNLPHGKRTHSILIQS